ncbi:MAG TPA: hypothetical protein VFP96_16655 [Candidatus Acidoferrum sp.]|nr:hypothetical protein [Candidatus Acidoferrum sp.]
MGIFDFLFGKKECPLCGAKGAKTEGTRVRCPNPECRNFDGSVARGFWRGPRRTDFSPQNLLEIRYKNFRGEEKTFRADGDSLRRRANHISALVAPTGERISLSRDRIQNLAEVETAMPPEAEDTAKPNARERQVLNYHKKHGSTSPLYEEIRGRFPDW